MSDNANLGARRNVLFLCTGNSARSSMAEAILNRVGSPRFQAYSAGSHPKGTVHPDALRLLKGLGYDTSHLRSKSWDEFTDGPVFDHIVTVCNNAAGEVCPIIAGKPAKTHWDIPDPASVRGTQAETEAAFRRVYDLLSQQIEDLVRRDGCHGRSGDLRTTSQLQALVHSSRSRRQSL